MSSRLSRRSFAGLFGAVATAGCLGVHDASPSDPDGGEHNDSGSQYRDDDSDDAPERCNLRSASAQGRGDPVETTVELERADDVEEECGIAASEAAFDRLRERLDTEIDTSGAPWIQSVLTSGADGDRVEIRVVAEKSSEATGDGSYHTCPPPEYDFDEVVRAVPSEVTVRYTDDEYECTREVWVEQRRRQLD